MAKDPFEILAEILENAEYEPGAVSITFREDQSRDSIENYLNTLSTQMPLRYVRQEPCPCVNYSQQIIPGKFRENYDLFTDPGREGEIFDHFSNYRCHCIGLKPK